MTLTNIYQNASIKFYIEILWNIDLQKVRNDNVLVIGMISVQKK